MIKIIFPLLFYPLMLFGMFFLMLSTEDSEFPVDPAHKPKLEDLSALPVPAKLKLGQQLMLELTVSPLNTVKVSFAPAFVTGCLYRFGADPGSPNYRTHRNSWFIAQSYTWPVQVQVKSWPGLVTLDGLPPCPKGRIHNIIPDVDYMGRRHRFAGVKKGDTLTVRARVTQLNPVVLKSDVTYVGTHKNWQQDIDLAVQQDIQREKTRSQSKQGIFILLVLLTVILGSMVGGIHYLNVSRAKRP